MAWHTPRTWKPHDIRLTAAVLNYELRDELQYLYANIADLTALEADVAALEAAVAALEADVLALQTVEAWINISGGVGFAAGWVDEGTGGTPGYYKDPFGVVHLRGHVNNGGAGVGTIFTLPAGYRPASLMCYIVRSDLGVGTGISMVNVNTSGTVVYTSGGPWLALDHISFRAS